MGEADHWCSRGYDGSSLELPIADNNGDPLWGGTCACPAYHYLFFLFMEGEIEANEITDGVLEGVDVGAVNVCEHRAAELGMDWNNCAEAVAASPGPPEHRGTCSFWAREGFCELEFMGTGTGTGGMETDTGD